MNTSPKDSNLSLSTRPKAVSVNALTQHSTVCTAHSIHKSQPGPRGWMCGKSCQLQLDKPDYNGLRRLQIVPMCIPILLRKYLQRSRDGSVSFSSPCRFKVVPQVSRVMEGEYDSLVWGLDVHWSTGLNPRVLTCCRGHDCACRLLSCSFTTVHRADEKRLCWCKMTRLSYVVSKINSASW